jgi:hypothetical protein
MVLEDRASLYAAYHCDTSPSAVLQAVSQEIQDKLDCCRSFGSVASWLSLFKHPWAKDRKSEELLAVGAYAYAYDQVKHTHKIMVMMMMPQTKKLEHFEHKQTKTQPKNTKKTLSHKEKTQTTQKTYKTSSSSS